MILPIAGCMVLCFYMINVLQTEVLLNMLNMVLAKAVSFKDEEIVKKISDLRHKIYYEDFDYGESIVYLKAIEKELEKRERKLEDQERDPSHYLGVEMKNSLFKRR